MTPDSNSTPATEVASELKRNVLLIDDDANMHLICKKILTSAGYGFYSSAEGGRGLEMLKQYPIDLILLDYMMPGMDGYGVLQKLKESQDYRAFKDVPVIMMTAFADENPMRARFLEMGLSLFLNKPFGNRELVNVIENVLVTNKIQAQKVASQTKRLEQAQKILEENRKLRSQLEQEDGLQAIIGTSDGIRRIKERIKRVADTEASVLITGESGTGKELVAKAIHDCSNRSRQNFVAVDCVALPANLLESELFGYEKGAFTGANAAKKGLMEIANNGTFFLDEIGELNPELQAKLLRVLQERQFRHIGGKDLIEVDIRVVAATNRIPMQAVKEGVLREDLYYRLNVVPIHLPPLRERSEDVPLLLHHFLKKFNHKNARGVKKIDDDALRALCQYDWPGNIRELQNVVERMVSLSVGERITTDDLPEHLGNNSAQVVTGAPFDAADMTLREARALWLEKYERKYLVDLIDLCNGNISSAARKAGVNRMTIYRMIKKYDIKMKFQIEELS